MPSCFRCSATSDLVCDVGREPMSAQATRSHPRISLAQIIALSRTAHSSVNRYLWVSLPDDEAQVSTVLTEGTPKRSTCGPLGTEGRGR
jgi:hypothetical protein